MTPHPDAKAPRSATRHVRTDDGARLAAFVSEPAAASPGTPTVVLAHGWTLDHRSWEPVVERLVADGDVRVVAWDQRGHGASTLANGGWRSGGESVRALGADLLAVVDACVPKESRLVLAGHSMGGMTVMAFAGLHPDVIGERVDGVVLVSTSAGDLRGPKLPGLGLAINVISRLPLRLGRLVTMGSQRRGGFGLDPREDDVRAAREQIGSTRLSTTGAFYRALMAHDEVAALAALARVPVRILVGSRDILTPQRHARALAEAMPDAELTVLDGRGHMLTYEAPDEVHDAIRAVMGPHDA